MSKKFVQKNIKLSLELDRYLGNHPRAYGKIPKGARIVITIKGDEHFNHESKALSGKVRARDSKKYVEARKEGKTWILQPLVASK